jgi:hypothetical protein
MSEITKYDNNFLNFNEMKEASTIIADSGLFPAYDSPEKIMTLMLLCKSEQCDPLKATMRYDLINGKPSKRSQAMLEDFINVGGVVNWIETDSKIAKAEFVAPNGSSIIESFTIEEAKQAGLIIRDNWRKYPKSMLRARCIASALRAIYPTSTGLMHQEDEIQEYVKEEKKIFKTKEDITIEVGEKEVVKIDEKLLKIAKKQAEKVQEVEVIKEEKDDNVNSLANTIKELDYDKLVSYLKSINWIESSIDELNEEQKKTIVDKWDAFKGAVNAIKEKE